MNAMIVVADAGHARLFRIRQSWKDLVEQEALIHSASRLRDRQLASDAAGRARDPQSTLDPRTTAKEHEEHTFAKELGRHLKHCHSANPFDELILVASPRFLGMLRAELPAPLDRLESRTIQKDLIHMDGEELAEYIRNYR